MDNQLNYSIKGITEHENNKEVYTMAKVTAQRTEEELTEKIEHLKSLAMVDHNFIPANRNYYEHRMRVHAAEFKKLTGRPYRSV